MQHQDNKDCKSVQNEMGENTIWILSLFPWETSECFRFGGGGGWWWCMRKKMDKYPTQRNICRLEFWDTVFLRFKIFILNSSVFFDILVGVIAFGISAIRISKFRKINFKIPFFWSATETRPSNNINLSHHLGFFISNQILQ